MNIKFLDLYAQYLSIKDEIDEAIYSVIKKSAFIGGSFLEHFEEEFADYIGVKHAIGVANGTDALEIALWTLDLEPNSEVILPVNSFIATAEAVINSGYVPVFADIDDDFCISLDSIKRLLTPKTRAIIPVHLYGQPASMDKILEFAKEHSLFVIEDCAQAHGAKFCNKRVGSFGILGAFSFYPGKNLGAFGDGGMIVTNDEVLAKKIRMYKNHGRLSKYNHEFVGRNSRLDGLQAAILSVKLKYLDGWLEHRNKLASYYLTHLRCQKPHVKDNIYHSWHLFVVILKNRNLLLEKLKNNNIEYGIHYPKLLSSFEFFKKYRYENSKAILYENNLLSLPIGEHLNLDDIKRVIEVLNLYDNS